MIKKLFGFLKGVVSGCFKYVMNFVKETISNAPAAVILGTSAIGITSLLSKTSISSLFIPVPFINEAMITIALGCIATYTLAMIAQVWNYEPV